MAWRFSSLQGSRFNETLGLWLMRQQRFDFLAHVFVARTSFLEEGPPLGRFPRQQPSGRASQSAANGRAS
jgi:hypothetical protein